MVRAELIYNPYLLETEVRFNGMPPRINSLVEKYQNEKLQTWVSSIPSIFYDEMNGFDFELDFSGTELDFEEVKRSFVQAGVGKNLVQLFHKGELQSRHEKSVAIDEFLLWLKNNPNRKFDAVTFREKNRELFERAYPFVVLGGTISAVRLFPDIDVSIENVESADELRKTDLHSTPILFCLDRKSVASLQHNLLELLKRNDITQEQLFFMISPALGKKAERVIRDLGVKEPQVVEAADDPCIYHYLELFPVSEYINAAIKVFREQAETIGAVLEEENRQSEITNKDVHEKIRDLGDTVARLKAAKESFLSKENIEMPTALTRASGELLDGINRWKNKKTKTTRIEEARSLANELEIEVNHLFDSFVQAVNQTYAIQCAAILSRCEEWYQEAQYKEDYRVENIEAKELSQHSVQPMVEELLKIKDEQYVTPKEDFFGKIFKTTEETPQEPVLETTYYFEKWRSYAGEIAEPVAEEMANEAYSGLQEYFHQLSSAYTERIEYLIQEVTAEKEQVSSQLSEDEQLLQADNDWHTAFSDKLRDIERA